MLEDEMQTSQKLNLFKAGVQSYSGQFLIGIMLLFSCSQIQIPLKPVPITLQTLAVMLISLTYKPRQAFEVVFSYLLLGAAGAPVFSDFSGGFTYFMGPTGGYLAGFLVAAPLISVLFSKSTSKSWLVIFMSCLVGQAIIYFCGVVWLAQFTGFDVAIKVGVLPFIFTGLVKIAAFVIIVQLLREVLHID